MNPFTMWCNWVEATLRNTKSRKGSRFGWPEPMETMFEKMDDEIKETIDKTFPTR